VPAIGGAAAAAAARQHAKQQSAADEQWKKVQTKNAGGHTGRDGFTTNFEGSGGLLDLRSMVMHADPDAIDKVSTQWTTIGAALDESAAALGSHVDNLLQNWTGQSADAFRENAVALNTSLTNGAQYAHQTSAAMKDASFALSEAQREMPDMPSHWDRFTRAVTSESGDIQFKQDAASQGLDYAVQHDGAQLSAVEQAHQKAVLVMEKVGAKYNAASALLSDTPPKHIGSGGVWPAPPVGNPGSPVTKPKGTLPASPRTSGIPGGGGGDEGKAKAIQGGITPASLQKQPLVNDPGGVNGGIDGGMPAKTIAPPGSTLDGVTGGPTTGTGTGSVDTGGGAVGGGGGIGTGSGGPAGGGVYGAVGGAGGGGLGGGRLSASMGGKRSGSGGLGGESGLAAEGAGMESGVALGESEAALAARERAGAGSEGSAGMGMGGMGGAGRGSAHKKKRKSRAAYLLEDEETWAQNAAPNPPVIG
jgi:uncharacterized protein YukE